MSYIVPVLTVIASFGGAWLAAHFALRRFYRERIWERKAAAYTAIFKALHEMARWYDEHYEAEIEKYEIDQDELDELRQSYAQAQRALGRRIASETWLLPDQCVQMMSDLVRTLKYRGENWQEHLEVGSVAIQSTVDRLRPIVREELRISAR